MKLKQACVAGTIALASIVTAPSAPAVVVAVGVGVPHPGHYCWHHRCWAYRWHGGYYNYYWHGRYWRSRWHCGPRWCYR